MWKNSYEVGIDLIDTQHKLLFKAIENLKENMEISDKSHYKKRLFETTAFLKEYCHIHFRDEQEYMQSIGFEGYEEHRLKHDKLLNDVAEYRNKMLKTNFDHRIVESYLGFLATWLIYHIGVEDQQIPKREHPAPPKQKYEGIYHEYADSIKAVLNILSGLSEQDISYALDCKKHLDSGVCYQVKLAGAQKHSGLSFIFSERLAYGLVKEMTTLDALEFIDVMYSALKEVSEIIGAKIAGLQSRETGVNISIELPKLVEVSDIHETSNCLVVYTQLGPMEMLL